MEVQIDQLPSINTLRFYLCVCLSVRDGCGRGRNEFAGRVKNHHVRSSCHRNGYNLSRARDSKSCCWSGHSALQATRRMPLWTLAIALATGKNTGLFGVLDQNKTQFSTYVSQRAESKAATVTIWVASRGQWISYSNSFVSKVLGANYNRANNFHPVADKFAMH